jgi:hypothetical protein
VYTEDGARIKKERRGGLFIALGVWTSNFGTKDVVRGVKC